MRGWWALRGYLDVTAQYMVDRRNDKVLNAVVAVWKVHVLRAKFFKASIRAGEDALLTSETSETQRSSPVGSAVQARPWDLKAPRY